MPHPETAETSQEEEDGAVPGMEKLPTLLVSRGVSDARMEMAEKARGPSLAPEPSPQVLGASAEAEDAEEDLAEDQSCGSPRPPYRMSPEDAAREEEFWTKAQEALADRGRREQLLQFLRAHHFKDVNSSAGWFLSYRFPLHKAVEENDACMVGLLLHYKAKTKLKDSNGLTAHQLARRRNMKGSHDDILKVFAEHSAARRRRAEKRRAAREARERAKAAAGEADAIPKTPAAGDVAEGHEEITGDGEGAQPRDGI
eukprot:TRINITY_DN1798_c0_g1_i3.p1 TRINITY_DN1798_c0_g1~~TRINITY_DN1798_c0_g1_i3.p1  ORF type:complete len:256 (+),score=71.45 TRINITY_DN1798_c0_g1_i3:34-801(+)